MAKHHAERAAEVDTSGKVKIGDVIAGEATTLDAWNKALAALAAAEAAVAQASSAAQEAGAKHNTNKGAVLKVLSQEGKPVLIGGKLYTINAAGNDYTVVEPGSGDDLVDDPNPPPSPIETPGG